MGLNTSTSTVYWLGQSWELHVLLKQYYDSNSVTDSFLVRVPVSSAAMQLNQALDGGRHFLESSSVQLLGHRKLGVAGVN